MFYMVSHLTIKDRVELTGQTDKHDHGPFRFLDLPKEIRELVYKHCVVANGAIDPYRKADQPRIALLCSQKPDLGLLYVNKLVGREAKDTLFGRNKWRLFYESENIIACNPWNMAELEKTLWNTHLKSFRHIITGFDFFREKWASSRVVPNVTMQPVPPIPSDLEGEDR